MMNLKLSFLNNIRFLLFFPAPTGIMIMLTLLTLLLLFSILKLLLLSLLSLLLLLLLLLLSLTFATILAATDPAAKTKLRKVKAEMDPAGRQESESLAL